ncbi:hypothetical protein B0J15DRAFT_594071 [Fusarium solani]|uniref:Uncharacterized protein n=1 Tax=Fusarium solani TaxID=169388 RepID=A0A9P9KKA1_FUSSL|nr:uncharacterized protein B0J15DRAFT_594071 [Fusarium solani]KAH7260265.1 hypothetical protein B0J15DRAFT_594071 [Fusarium solani]
MSDMFTVDYDTYKGKSIAEMIDVLKTAFDTLQQNFPDPGEHSQVLRDDIDNLCKMFREWSNDPELSLKAGASKDIANQMRKLLYAIGSLLDAVDNIHTGRCLVDTYVKMLGDGYLNEVDSHLRSLHDKSAAAKKEMEKKKKKESK